MRRVQLLAAVAFMWAVFPLFVLADCLRNAWRLNLQAFRWTAGEARMKADELRRGFRTQWDKAGKRSTN